VITVHAAFQSEAYLGQAQSLSLIGRVVLGMGAAGPTRIFRNVTQYPDALGDRVLPSDSPSPRSSQYLRRVTVCSWAWNMSRSLEVRQARTAG
jgi:hypothetical protein